MTYTLNGLSHTGMMELAHATYDSVHDPGGELEIGMDVLKLGINRHHWMTRYSVTAEGIQQRDKLETALRGLRRCLDQRVQTADDFLQEANTEIGV